MPNFLGTKANETLIGSNSDDFLNGMDGDDELFGLGGDDRIWGGAGNDSMTGGAGNDTIWGQDGIDELIESGDVDFTLSDFQLLGIGTDQLSGIEIVTLIGGIRNNRLDASAFNGQVKLYGHRGNDILLGGYSDDTLDGGEGNDSIEVYGDNNSSHYFSLSNNQFTGKGTDQLVSIEQATLVGGVLSDSINASTFTGQTLLRGGSGDDWLIGAQGQNQLEGESGNDWLQGGLNDDRLFGGTGFDWLTGGFGNDTINGGSGRDTLSEFGDVNFQLTDDRLLGLGNDRLISIESVHLVGGSSANRIDASHFNGLTTLIGQAGNDILIGGQSSDSLSGGEGSDRLIGGYGSDDLTGDNGSDRLSGGEGDDFLDGGEGIDWIEETRDTNFDLRDTILSISSRDGSGVLERDALRSIERAQLTGGGGNNVLSAYLFSGSVYLFGQAGRDDLRGGANHDFLDGGSEDDQLSGWAGNDYLFGNSGNDVLSGGSGNDVLNGGAGIDRIEEYGVNFILSDTQLTGSGTDQLISIEQVSLHGGDVSYGSNSLITAAAFTGLASLYGNSSNDLIIGGSGGDLLVGWGGSDLLMGGGGDDRLYGWGPSSYASGRHTVDSLVGGSGRDVFILGERGEVYYDDGFETTIGIEDYAVIRDFNSSEDRIQLTGTADRYTLSPGWEHDGWSGTAVWHAGEIIAVVQGVTGLNLADSYFIFRGD